MNTASNRWLAGAFVVLTMAGCGIYSFTGADTSGAQDFSVGFFRSQTALASPSFSQDFTEALKDLILQQSNLKLVQRNGQLNYEGSITDYRIAPVGVQATETAAQNRLSVTVRVKYTNTLEPDKSFERNFTKFTDYDSAFDLLALEAELNRLIIDQLIQEIFNASLGNW